MKLPILYIFFLLGIASVAQSNKKVVGFLGIYHTAKGFTYKDSLGIDSITIQQQFQFGELNIPSQLIDNGFLFNEDIDSSISWHPNKILGMIQPPSEGGKINQPLDTALYNPFDISFKPGMVQAAQRFSRLSKMYGPVCGVIMDDWDIDTFTTHQVRDAVQGKFIDSNGKVDYLSEAKTPHNKLYAVIYYPWIDPIGLPFIDGVSYWLVDSQNCCYKSLEKDIDAIRLNIPHKDIQLGIYLKNSHLGWTNDSSVRYLLQHAINSYDDGLINGITLFAGPYLNKQNISLPQWNLFALPRLLDSIYYPYLSEATGQLIDCNTNLAMQNINVEIYSRGKLSGDVLLRSRQNTDSLGKYSCGLWTGNRNTDSTYYWVVAAHEGYTTDSIGFWMKRNKTTTIPYLNLCPNSFKNSKDNITLFPNPVESILNINVHPHRIGTIEILDLIGQTLYTQNLSLTLSEINITSLKAGYYFIKYTSDDGRVGMKSFIKK